MEKRTKDVNFPKKKTKETNKIHVKMNERDEKCEQMTKSHVIKTEEVNNGITSAE